MTEEEYFRKHYPDFCYGERLLSPYWDLFRDGVEFGERESEKQITKLKQGNKELQKLVQQREQRGLEVQEDLLKEKAELKQLIEKMINEIDKTMCLSNMREREIYDIQEIFRKYDFRRDSNDKWEMRKNE